ncbi:MAG: Minf_1886 family protein [Planctomycetota bacterium]
MEEVILADGRYPPEAYAFLHDGLSRAAKQVHGVAAPTSGEHHVTGQEICEAIRELAIERWGMMARTVLAKWNIRRTIDFGNMVYLMISHGFMHKTEEDSLEDFHDVYDFDEAFGPPSQFKMEQ